MNYSLGCAFNLDEIIMNFPYKKLKINCNDSIRIVNAPDRGRIVKRVFMYNFLLVLEDIVERNVTFNLPNMGSRKSKLCMGRIMGTAFRNLRRGGKWKNLDFVKTNFQGFEIKFHMLGNRTPRIKTMYVGRELRDRIVQNANNGTNYGDSKYDTTVEDYLELTCTLYPEVPKSDVLRILKYCWKSIYLHNSYGGDVLLNNNRVWAYFGKMRKDSLAHFYYYIRKLSTKLRIIYKRKRIPWDGYYYFALTNKAYENLLSLKNKKGRPKKYFKYGNVMAYMLYEECKIMENSYRYIFRIPYAYPIKMKIYIPNLVSDKCELFKVLEPRKFKDILVTENKYEIL